MPHILLSSAVADISEAGSRLRAGRCVAFPTETVYGLGANALNASAVALIFKFKGRPLTDPLIVHVPDTRSAEALVILSDSERLVFRALAAKLWPGPLTLVAKAQPIIPASVTANTGWVGVRVPNFPLALSLLHAAGVPIAAPSANRFGHVSPTRASHVVADLGEHDIAILVGDGEVYSGGHDGGFTFTQQGDGCHVGIESTVVRIQEEEDEKGEERKVGDGGSSSDHGGVCERKVVSLSILRRGGTLADDLRKACESVVGVNVMINHVTTTAVAATVPVAHAPVAVTEEEGGDKQQVLVGLLAPGMLLTHYAPDLPSWMVRVELVGSGSSSASSSLLKLGDLRHTVILDYGGQISGLLLALAGGGVTVVCHLLYKNLHLEVWVTLPLLLAHFLLHYGGQSVCMEQKEFYLQTRVESIVVK